MHDLHLLIAQYGLLLVFANVLINQLGAPIPAVPTLIVAGALAGSGDLSPAAVFALAVLACVIADSIWFVAGRRYGHQVLKTICKVSLSPDSCVRQSETIFEKWGARTLVVAKFVPGLSTIAPPLAGATHLGWTRFTLFNSIGAALWVGVAMGAGLLLHEQIDRFIEQMAQMGEYALAAIGALLLVFIAFKWWERRRFYRALRMARISVHELHRLMTEGHAPAILDVRSHCARVADGRQIPGAVAVDIDKLDFTVTGTPVDREVVVYCTCPNEASAARVAKLLQERGFKRVRPLAGGLDAWADAGLPVAPVVVAVSSFAGVSQNIGQQS
jgi:membrane protein DedA with SNARE-associated domain/rhodanese-related sulfurtransferase